VSAIIKIERGWSQMNKAGFTLIEVLVAIILVGLAIAALVAAGSSFTRANAAGAELATAEFLIEQIRELTATLSYDELGDFNGKNFCPPIDANRNVLNDFAAFTQKITVENVSKSDLRQVVGYDSGLVRVSVEVSLNSRPISSVSWIRANYAR
jgi:prepilin-type N-terminal cleavage/methylation domain-containing protein